MSNPLFNPLSVIINPPGIQYGMPGDIVSIYAVVINEGDKSAVIDLFFTFDETFQKISGWSASPKASLAVAPKESSDEVTFDFEIPVDALAGTYDYTFVVDSPEHYPQDTPISFPGQLKVLLKEQTVIRAFDPTFSLIPATNPNKPITYRLDQPLQVVVKVENRSNRVDRFRLNCPDLDDDWFKISYPASGLEGVGLFDVSALELNPNTEGEISLEICFPINTLAGSYSPTIRLLSENNPDLILLDLIYINLSTNYQVSVELNTILGKVSHKDGVYELVVNNQGNLIRELFLTAKTRDEEEICTYKFNPRELKLLPSITEKVSLLVKPGSWWRQPLFGQPLPINFEVNITDKQSYPLANASPQATLLWKARPWWQFLLLILLGLGLFASATYLIWRLLNPDPLRIDFSTESPTIIEGGEVNLKLKVDNYKRLKNLIVTIVQPPGNKPVLEYDNKSINELISNNKTCKIISQEQLECTRIPTRIKDVGKYVLKLEVSQLQNLSFFNPRVQTPITQTAQVEVTQKPISEVVEFKTNQRQYQKGDRVSLIWKMKRPELVSDIKIDTMSDSDVQVSSKILPFKDGNIADPQYQKACIVSKEDKLLLNCKIDDLIANQVGNFSYRITVRTNGVINRNSTADSKIEVLPQEFKIVYFKINDIDNSKQQNIVLNEGEQATISWKVEGEDISVKLSLNDGDVPQTGMISQIPVNLEFPNKIVLTVTDKLGKRESKPQGFFITIKPKPTPTPDLVTPSPLPTQRIL
jgi:hypothetical protein